MTLKRPLLVALAGPRAWCDSIRKARTWTPGVTRHPWFCPCGSREARADSSPCDRPGHLLLADSDPHDEGPGLSAAPPSPRFHPVVGDRPTVERPVPVSSGHVLVTDPVCQNLFGTGQSPLQHIWSPERAGEDVCGVGVLAIAPFVTDHGECKGEGRRGRQRPGC